MNLVNSVGNGVARVQFDGGEGGFTGSGGWGNNGRGGIRVSQTGMGVGVDQTGMGVGVSQTSMGVGMGDTSGIGVSVGHRCNNGSWDLNGFDFQDFSVSGSGSKV